MFVSRKCVDFLIFVLVILILVIPRASFISNKLSEEETNNVDKIELGSSIRRFLALKPASNDSVNTTSSSSSPSSPIFHIQVTAIHIDKSEFPLSKLLFKLTLKLALDSAEKRLESRRIKLSLSIRSANTCSRQYAGAVAAEEYYLKRTRLFIVSGCDDAIRGVSRLASGWQVPVMTAAGFGADLNDKTIHKSLIRVAFSLKTAVEFLVKVLKSFQWKRVNLIVDESDTNSLALKDGIEKNFAHFNAQNESTQSFILNTISLDLKKSTLAQQFHNNLNQSADLSSRINGNQSNYSFDDKWPNNLTETSVRDALKQSSLFSRVNILLIPQHYLRKFMLSVYDQGMANGLYTFINMPLLFSSNSEDQLDNAVAISGSNYSKQSYVTSTGENVFIWRSLLSTRNSQAKQAFESLMLIYLKTPTTKAYIYFANKLSNLANTNYATTTTTATTIMKPSNKQGSSSQTNQLVFGSNKIQLSINPYSASFYDCLQIYAIVLDELFQRIKNESDKSIRKKLRLELHSNLINSMRNRRYDNLVTGSISLNTNGDREADYTLDDLNQMTGKFSPVILYKGETSEIERLSRIQWSSFDNVGPTIDNVDCSLNNTCPSKPWSRFLITILLMAAPPAIIMGSILYFVYNKIRLESQLVDYWWKISLSDIEIVLTKRKTAGNCSSIVTNGSQVSVPTLPSIKLSKSALADETQQFKDSSVGINQTVKSGITKVTNTSVAYNSSVGDVCYGDIVLGIYKMAKVALKPISKFHQSRKLMIELRTVSIAGGIKSLVVETTMEQLISSSSFILTKRNTFFH